MKIKPLEEWNSTGKPLVIAGPCAAESKEQLIATAKEIAAIDPNIIFRAGIWKPRTRPGSFQGVGEQGIEWLMDVKRLTGLEVATEVATPEQARKCIEAGITHLWIGARTTVNPFYVEEIAKAMRGHDVSVMVKNPVHPDINAWIGSIERFADAGIQKLIAIHRGFHPLPESKYRNYPNWSIPLELKQRYPGLPIISDPSHMAGKRALVEQISQDAMDINMDGLMIETHINPDNALSDKLQQLTPPELKALLGRLVVHNDILQSPNALENFRGRIDKIDHDIIDLLASRMEISKHIASIKKEHDMSFFQLERWQEILDSRAIYGEQKGLRKNFVRDLLGTVHAESIAVQKKMNRD